MKWYPSLDQVAQMSHFAIAWAIVATCRVYGLQNIDLLVVVGWATVKEFVFDIIVEGDSWSDSWEDWCWYGIGGLAAHYLMVWTT